MPSTQASLDSSENDINLKHRLTGAAVLIFFGALFLPWLLGPPSEAKKVTAEVEEVPKRVHSTFEDDVLAQLQEDTAQSNFIEPEETVYISKITPVNGKNVASKPEPLNNKVADSDDADKVQVKPEQISNTQTEADKGSDAAKTQAAKTQAVVKNTVKSKDPVPVSDTPSSELNTKVKTTKPALVTQKVDKAKTKAPTKPTPKVAAKPKEIDVGWIVQVELLTDKKGAQKLVENLKDKNFNPKTTVVDTNKGKATGTRIWVGPFESRKQANAENERLESKMGKRGFIRVYP